MGGEKRGFYMSCLTFGLYEYDATDDDIAVFLDKCAEAGVRRLLACFYRDCVSDRFGTMVEGAHKRGMEILGYRAIGNMGSRDLLYHSNVGEPWPPKVWGYALTYPGCWTRTREDRTWLEYDFRHPLGQRGYLDFSSAVARVYERSKALELVEGYGVDGFQIEWIASPPPPGQPAKDRAHTIEACLDEQGYWAYGYDKVVVERFKSEYGEDPRELPGDDERWVDLRCSFVTDYVRDMKADLVRANHKVEISAQAVSGVFTSRKAGRQVNFDWGTWVDEGLIDAVYPRYPAHYPKLRLAYDEETIGKIRLEVASLKETLGDKASLMAGLLLPTYSQFTRELTTPGKAAQALRKAVQATVEGGADMVGIYRADRFDALGLWPYLKELTQLVS